jgi:hypothetical protein
MVSHGLIAGVLVAMLLVPSEGGTAVDSRTGCQADKNKHAGKYLACRMKIVAAGLRAAEAPDFSTCDARFAAAWRKAEERARRGCPTLGDVDVLRRNLERCTTEASTALETNPRTPPPPCLTNGFLVGGHCWFVGGAGESCNDRCMNQALVYDDATESFAGSGGSLTGCQKLVNGYLAIVQPGLSVGVSDLPCADLGLGGLGCAGLGVGFAAVPVRCTTPSTTALAAHPEVARFCACMTP